MAKQGAGAMSLEEELATMVRLREYSVGVDLKRVNYRISGLQNAIAVADKRQAVAPELAGTKAHLSLEAYLDEEFRLLGVAPYIYHIQPIHDIYPPGSPRAVTIASVAPINVEAVRNSLFSIEMLYWRLGRRRSQSIASFMKQQLEADGCVGIAICDYRDQFSRKRGRIIVKGRLFKLLRKEGSRCI